jgi:hypothetical protein
VYIAESSGARDLVSLLNNNSPAQEEVSTHTQFWVQNGPSLPTFGSCLAVNKGTGQLDRIPCKTNLPTICYNSASRRVLLSEDTSRQVKLNTPVGMIQGWRDQNSFRFLGIPYAEPPVDQLRFAAPMAKKPFKDTWNANYYRPACPQTRSSAGLAAQLQSFAENGYVEDEDCLYLNVYTPSLKGVNETLLPVLFFLHGGASVR